MNELERHIAMFPHAFDGTQIAFDLKKDNVSIVTYASVRHLWEKYRHNVTQSNKTIKWLDTLICEINGVMDDLNETQ